MANEIFYCAGGSDGYVTVQFFNSRYAMSLEYDFNDEQYGCTDSEGSFFGECNKAQDVIDVFCNIMECLDYDEDSDSFNPTELEKLFKLVKEQFSAYTPYEAHIVTELMLATDKGVEAYFARVDELRENQ